MASETSTRAYFFLALRNCQVPWPLTYVRGAFCFGARERTPLLVSAAGGSCMAHG